MSGSVARPSLVRQQYVNSLMFEAGPPTPEELHDRLAKASSSAAWTAWAAKPGDHAVCAYPMDDVLEEAETDLLLAYLAVYATRHQ